MFKFKNKEMPLPTNRFELLGDVLRYRMFEIILLSIYMFLFLVPSLLWLIFSGYLFSNVENHTIYEVILTNGVNIIFIMIFGLGCGGAFYFLKKVSFQEGESINSDFFMGIKKNWKMFLFIYFLIGLTYAFLEIGVAYINYEPNMDNILKGVLEGILYAGFILFMMIFFFMQTQTILYSATISQLFLNAIKFTFGSFLKNLGIFFILLLPLFLFEFIPSLNGVDYFQYVSIVLEGIFYFGFSYLVFSLYSNHVFDLTINKKYPENIRKGLANNDKNISNN